MCFGMNCFGGMVLGFGGNIFTLDRAEDAVPLVALEIPNHFPSRVKKLDIAF